MRRAKRDLLPGSPPLLSLLIVFSEGSRRICEDCFVKFLGVVLVTRLTRSTPGAANITNVSFEITRNRFLPWTNGSAKRLEFFWGAW